MWKEVFMKRKNQPKKETFKYEQEGPFYLGVAKVESRDGKITGKRCPVFKYTDKEIVTVDDYQKTNPKWICKNKVAYFVVVTMGRKIKTDKIWLYESIDKLKGIWNQG